MMVNKYPGTCACGSTVPAGQGFYDYGQVFCEEPTTDGCFYGCAESIAQSKVERQKERDRNAGNVDRNFVSEFADVNEYIAKVWAFRDEKAADPEYQAQQKARSERIQREDDEWAKQGRKRCNRCGGAGHADKWHATGSVCFKCQGVGAVAK